jgi:hypothetical protein
MRGTPPETDEEIALSLEKDWEKARRRLRQLLRTNWGEVVPIDKARRRRKILVAWRKVG